MHRSLVASRSFANDSAPQDDFWEGFDSLGFSSATTNSTRSTSSATYLLITARYCGASACNSARQLLSGTSTRKVPLLKSSARVRAATTEPQARAQASTGPSPAGARRRLELTIFSNPALIGSSERPINKNGTDRNPCLSNSSIANFIGKMRHGFELYFHDYSLDTNKPLC